MVRVYGSMFLLQGKCCGDTGVEGSGRGFLRKKVRRDGKTN